MELLLLLIINHMLMLQYYKHYMN